MKVISCFSYKGGAGRSTLGLNVIPFLADELGATSEHPLVVVDMDVDSCGLTYLFNVQVSKDFTVQSLFGEKGYIPNDDGVPLDKHDLFRELKPIGGIFNREPKSILFLPALPGGSLGDQSNSYEGNPQLVKEFVNECRENDICGIFLDSAVGDQLTAKWSNLVSKYILCCLRPTKQFREGTKRFFDKFDTEKKNKTIIVIPNVVPTEELRLYENGNLRVYPDYAKEQIINNFASNIDAKANNYIMDLVNGEIFGVPKVDRFMWQEEILDNLAKSELTECEQKAKKQYQKIASLIAKN